MLSRKLNVPFVCLNKFILSRTGVYAKLPDEQMFVLTPDDYDNLNRDTELEEKALEWNKIFGPGIYYFSDVFFQFAMYECRTGNQFLTPKVYVFHEFCEYLALEERPPEIFMRDWHGHHSLDVVIETLRFAQRIRQLDGILSHWESTFKKLSESDSYPDGLKKRMQRVFTMARTGELFKGTQSLPDSRRLEPLYSVAINAAA
jgi:hypothetical protein